MGRDYGFCHLGISRRNSLTFGESRNLSQIFLQPAIKPLMLSATPLSKSGVTELSENVGTAEVVAAIRHRGSGLTAWSYRLRLLALIAIYLVIAYVLPRPASVTPGGWRITAIFLSTIVGFVLQPVSGAVLVILAVTSFVLIGGVPMTKALSGFASPSLWLVIAAVLMSRAMADSGLSRRIALIFVRRFGTTSLGVSYSLAITDVVLASGIPSITARSGGIVLPITRSIALLYGSTPGETAAKLGTFLMASVYQASAVACAMFLTGQASNVLAAGMAAQLAGVHVTWSSWLIAAVAPGIASCIAIPYLVYRMLPPLIRRTPAAADFANTELLAMGGLSRSEKVVLGTVSCVCGLWVTTNWHGLDVTLVALAGVSTLFLFNVLTWNNALTEKTAWDMLVWYGGLIMMGELLNDTGTPKAFALWVQSQIGHLPWIAVLVATLVLYFYVHYAFATITAHVLALFPVFVVMLVHNGTPPALAVYSLACLANLTAGLTHYGTTTAPIIFSERYINLRDWWRVGFAASLVNLAIWLTIGFAWWKLLRLW
jgi:DASS family divalent anion:Na+ symporter